VQAYDTIIVGAGSAGCVLARRLGEEAGARILLLEAGPADRHWLLGVPLGVGKVWRNPRWNWMYRSEPEPHVDNRQIFHPRGKVVGGSSSINMMAYVRGHRADFDRWAERGLAGWDYPAVLPYFKRAESFAGGDGLFRGRTGPLGISETPRDDPSFDAFMAAGRAAGYAETPDYNGAVQEGFGRVQYTIRAGRRSSTAVAYLRPALQAGGVELQTDAQVTRVLMEGTRAIGVEYRVGDTLRTARAEREVILCGGAMNSPQVLMLSGIGPADALRRHGIGVRVDLPAVGQNLWDHPMLYTEYLHARPSNWRRQLRLDRIGLSMARAHLTGRGFATEPPAARTAFVRSGPDQPIPDIQIIYSQSSMAAREWFPGFRPPAPDAFALVYCHLRPESRGSVALASADPLAKVSIRNNFLSTEGDRRAMREGLRFVQSMAFGEAFRGTIAGPTSPDRRLGTDAEIDAHIRANMITIYHPAGTCRIGVDADSVVDPEFRVRGTEGLRVVDASVIPEPLGGNINAPVIAIAEKAADIIRGRPPLPAEPVGNVVAR
jgi:choline dehydrogenase-like flavoprotein